MAQMRLTMEMVENGPSGTEQMLKALSGGSPAAIKGLRAILDYGPAVDPEYARLGVAYLFLIDTLQIWDADLATLWEQVCAKHAGQMIALIRSCQSPNEATFEDAARILRSIIKDWPNGTHIDFSVLERELRRKSPRFNMEAIP